MRRQTLANRLVFEGRGIHTNAESRLEIAPADDGIRLEMAGTGWDPLPADVAHAAPAECERRTVLRGPAGQVFQQMEHVMAALAACGVTDARLVQTGPEPPFLDGGSREYAEGLLRVGRTKLEGKVKPLEVTEPVHFADDGAELVATPHEGLRLSCFVEFPGTIVGCMGASLEVTPEGFLAEAAPARTFALERDIEALRQAGLARGGNLHNAVVFNDERYLNEALNFPDEVARHKIIDLLGDLALIGRPLRGHFWAWRAGHRSHVLFARKLAETFAA